MLRPSCDRGSPFLPCAVSNSVRGFHGCSGWWGWHSSSSAVTHTQSSHLCFMSRNRCVPLWTARRLRSVGDTKNIWWELCLIIMAKENTLQSPLKPHYLLKDSSYSLIFVSFYPSGSLFKASLHILRTLTQVLPFLWCRIGPCQNYDGIPKVFLQPKSFLM